MLGYYVDKDLNNETHAGRVIKKYRTVLLAIKRLVKEVPKGAAVQVIKTCMIGKITYDGFLYIRQKTI